MSRTLGRSGSLSPTLAGQGELISPYQSGSLFPLSQPTKLVSYTAQPAQQTSLPKLTLASISPSRARSPTRKTATVGLSSRSISPTRASSPTRSTSPSRESSARSNSPTRLSNNSFFPSFGEFPTSPSNQASPIVNQVATPQYVNVRLTGVPYSERSQTIMIDIPPRSPSELDIVIDSGRQSSQGMTLLSGSSSAGSVGYSPSKLFLSGQPSPNGSQNLGLPSDFIEMSPGSLYSSSSSSRSAGSLGSSGLLSPKSPVGSAGLLGSGTSNGSLISPYASPTLSTSVGNSSTSSTRSSPSRLTRSTSSSRLNLPVTLTSPRK